MTDLPPEISSEKLIAAQERLTHPSNPLWLVARPDGSMPRVLRAVNARGAILARFKDEDDRITWGVVVAWRLGSFPEQYAVDTDVEGGAGIVVRELGRPELYVGDVWRSKRETWRTVEITGFNRWNGELYVDVLRNTSRRRQPISETTLRRDYVPTGTAVAR